MKKSKTPKTITTEEFDRLFDEGETDLTEYLDLKNLKTSHPIQRINIDIPIALLRQIDLEANRIGIARTALIKVWISDRLKAHHG